MTSHNTVGGRLAGRAAGSLQGAVTKPSPLSTFDGGYRAPLRQLVQDSCAQLLSRLLVENGGYIEAIEPTDVIVRNVDDFDNLSDLLDQAQGRAPSIWIATGNIDDFMTAGDVDRWRAPLDVHVYFLNQSLRSKLSRTVADVVALADQTKDPGVFVALEHVRMLLCGKQPGNATGAIKELRPASERRIGADDDFCIWEQVYTVALSVQVDLKRDIDLELQQINAYHRLAEQASTDGPIVQTETKVGK